MFSWSLSYAGFSERITDVNSTIYDAKSKMEQSKKFKDALKKRKPADKLPVCSVKPTVTAQKKGILPFPAYKAVCESVEAAEQANVPICYIPSQNGQIYEMRRNEIGTLSRRPRNRGAGHDTGRVSDEPAPASSRQARGNHLVLPPCLRSA